MNYETATDFDINKAVAEALGFELSNYFGPDYGYYKIDSREYSALARVSDYCNNPSDAWPIILEHKIDLKHRFEGFDCDYAPVPTALAAEDGDYREDATYDHVHSDVNILRAAMIVFLKMKEQQS